MRNPNWSSSYRLFGVALTTLGVFALSACMDGVAEDFISDDPTVVYAEGDEGNEFDDEGSDDGGTGDDAQGGEGEGDELEISEADIIQMEGDRLYALSTYSGLSVVDMSDPDDLQFLGSWETDAEPFEMYVEAGRAFIMFNDFWFWEWDEGSEGWSEATSSRLIALDAADPANIEVEGEFTLPGRIQDSRRVGDVLYVVTLEDGYCWGCDNQPKTLVTSLDISDEAHPAIVDQFIFPAVDDNWNWQRSVESTNERMYVASQPLFWEGLGSFIDVVDISAGDGTLVAGDQVQVTGSVFSRWQMSEHEGVLRVISQLGGFDDPVIETFTIESSQSIVPLGSGSLSLPMPETLRSARFDGDRAYAITAEQTDPLFTIDLSDPANPKQVGGLEIPGWIQHMETRGDRVLALGFEPGNDQGSLNVSLFDVSVFDTPTLLRRVYFGGDWASFAEDQNRLHKAFSILDDEQMILVPHQGWSQGDGACYGSYRSGVQIIDWKNDDLILRGRVPARGVARRAFTHQEHIVTVSDMQLATFDYADRDAPELRDELALAVQVDELVRAEDVWVRIASDWWTGTQVLEIAVAGEPASPEPLSMIDLDDHDPCTQNQIRGVFVAGDHVFVVQHSTSWGEAIPTSRIIAVEIYHPAAPVLDDTYDVPGRPDSFVREIGNVSTQASWLAQTGDHLALLTQDDKVEVVDVSEPGSVTLGATLARPGDQTRGGLSVLSDTIVSWHTQPVEGQPGKVRFYFDRLDLSGSKPKWAPAINVPGIIVAYDSETGRAFTIDFALEKVALPDAECFEHPKYWSFEGDTCTLLERTLVQLQIVGSQAFKVQTLAIEGNAGLEQLFATDSRIFAKTAYDFEDTKLVLVDIASDKVELHEIDGEPLGPGWRITNVEGERAVVRQDGSLGLIDASKIAQPEVKVSAQPAWSACERPVIAEDTVYCPMGRYGLEAVAW